MKKESIRKLLLLVAILILSLCLSACGKSEYAGEWFSSDNLEHSFVLSEDGSYIDIYGGSGEWSEQDGIIMFIPNSGYSEAERMSITADESNNRCLLDSDGHYWYDNSETANEIYEKNVEEKLNRDEQLLFGTWQALGGTQLTINEDYTYEIVDDETGFHEIGKIETYRHNKYLCISPDVYELNQGKSARTSSLIDESFVTEHSDGIKLLGQKTGFNFTKTK